MRGLLYCIINKECDNFLVIFFFGDFGKILFLVKIRLVLYLVGFKWSEVLCYKSFIVFSILIIVLFVFFDINLNILFLFCVLFFKYFLFLFYKFF